MILLHLVRRRRCSSSSCNSHFPSDSIITKFPKSSFKELDPRALLNFLANFSMGCAIRAKPDLIDSTHKSKNDDDDDDASIIVAEIFRADLNTIAMSEVD